VAVGWDVSPPVGAVVVGSAVATAVGSGASAVPQATANIRIIPSSVINVLVAMVCPPNKSVFLPNAQNILDHCCAYLLPLKLLSVYLSFLLSFLEFDIHVLKYRMAASPQN
jgi:hypothetical protein